MLSIYIPIPRYNLRTLVFVSPFMLNYIILCYCSTLHHCEHHRFALDDALHGVPSASWSSCRLRPEKMLQSMNRVYVATTLSYPRRYDSLRSMKHCNWSPTERVTDCWINRVVTGEHTESVWTLPSCEQPGMKYPDGSSG